MALGFGFNKQKVLASAEKAVQQGKLQNAIAEYEKIVKEDPKDLTVLNTIGDLYARIGHNDKAAVYCKRVGDQYASDGFTVKAIAMYKKLTKLTPGASEAIIKLAELYTQQGLYNDARQQYVQIADQCMRNNELDGAARIFQKMLELDPENASMQARLADLYVKLGKKEEAKRIFLTAAQSLYARGSLDPSDEALARVLAIDPENGDAVLLRGQIAADKGDSAAAIRYLEKLPNLDSRPDALRSLLTSFLALKDFAQAEPLARKLLTIHNDLGGLNSVAEAMVKDGQYEAALHLFEQFADKFLAGDHAVLLEVLHNSIASVKDNAPALEIVLSLCRKAGDTSHINEVTELLAHAFVQAGQLPKARDLYKELAEAETENPLHLQNYKQIVARLGEDAALRPLTPQQAGQPMLVEELTKDAPTVPQQYSDEQTEAISAALTDSELFVSYNLPAKAIAPLEAILPKAPQHIEINQRLAALYERAERWADAAARCEVLRDVFSQAGHQDQAAQYSDMLEKYRDRASVAPAGPAVKPAYMPAGPTTPREVPLMPDPGRTTPAATPFEAGAVAEFKIDSSTPDAPRSSSAHEIDISDWETETPPAPPPRAAEPDIHDTVEEAKFYLSQGMLDQAAAAIETLAALAPTTPELQELRRQLESERKAATPAAAPTARVVEQELPAGESVAEFVFDMSAMESPAAQPEAVAPPPPLVIEPEPPPPPVVAKPVPPPPPVVAKPVPPPPPPPAPVAAPPAAAASDFLGDMVLDLESSLPADFAAPAPPPAAKHAPMAAAAPAPAPMPAAPAGAAAAAVAPAPETPPASAHFDGDATSALSDMFAEFKEDAEAGGTEEEDPDTHYNLGVAFKEMGLLDEAIGELQKVCHAIDHGKPFSQTMQAYTWLAQCFVDKGVPEASLKWYERALKFAAEDEDTRMALNYDLASAYEAAGDRPQALRHFMEVYGSNIDYRDVAERIKALKS